MRIAFVGLSSKRGGVESFIINTYQQIKKRSPEIQVRFLVNDQIDYFELVSPEDQFIIYPSRRENYIQFKKSVRDIFEHNAFDVLWFNCCSLSNIEELKIAHKMGVKKIILHSHNSRNMGGKLTGVLHDKHKKCAGKYVTDYFACSNVAAQWMFPENTEYTVINNSVDTDRFVYQENIARSQREKYGCGDKMVIGHVGRFHHQKNHTFLIDVFAEYLRLNPDCVLCLCGDGELKESIVEKIDELGISDHVVFTGQINNTQELYQMFDVFLFPSLFEGLPFALIEAQAAGIPCMISDTISTEVAITDLIHYESLQASPKVWAEHLDALPITRENTKQDLVTTGYDLDANAEFIVNFLQQ